jgi:outer membrane receptor protein involved in Fe transport
VSDDQRKENVILRYSHGNETQSYSLTGTFYHGLSTNTTDIPVRAITERLVPNRFGSLDGSDGVRANRGNLSFEYHEDLGNGQLAANVFYFHNELHLYNNFTHFLFDPVNGDQEEQFEFRDAGGGEASYVFPLKLLSIDNEFLVGTLARYDDLLVGRNASADRAPLPAFTGNDPASFTNRDRVFLLTTAAYLQATTHWTPWFRSVIGFREEYARGLDTDLQAAVHLASPDGAYTNSGESGRTLPQPKGSLIFDPTNKLEFYLSAGRGFHSADLRGVNQAKVAALGLPSTPFLASLVGEEVGMRAEIQKNLTFTLAFYNLDQQSETIIDPDIGADSPGPPSRRNGYEVNVTYKIRRWLELYGSFSGDHTRFRYAFDDGTGHSGTHITDAPLTTGSLALYLIDLGPWSGGLEYRFLGNFPLSSGLCDDAAVQHDFPTSGPGGAPAPNCAYAVADGLTGAGQLGGKGFGEFNLDATFAFLDGWSTSVGVYNLLNTKRNAAEFTYVDRLKSEITEYPDGRADTHIHSLEPISARLTVTKKFGFF